MSSPTLHVAATEDHVGAGAAPAVAAPRSRRGVSHAASAVLERSRYLVVMGSVTALALAVASFVWGVVKAGAFIQALVFGGGSDDLPLVKLFESIDIILVGTVLLTIGLGLWELFIRDLDLPPALTTTSFADLKAKIATTLLLVLVVRFLETVVSRPAAGELLELGIAVTLVGGLLMVFANWRR
jgi:uncharacterized membrane protein YqhA